MKLVISPAKSLDLESKIPTTSFSEPLFAEKSAELNGLLKKKTPSEISALMHISDKLGQLNYDRNQSWNLPFNPGNARQAIYTFSGDVYKGLDVYSLPVEKIELMQNTVLILSGLYGVLRPLDLMQAYRLEMGTKMPVGDHKNLYGFWKQSLTEMLNNSIANDEVFVNLASNEYFKAIDTKALKVPVINITFKEFKNDTYKTIAIFSKLARGLMTRYIIDNNAQSVDDLKGFNTNGYGLSEQMSSSNELVFTR